MRISTLLFVVGSALLLTGCSDLVSLNPIVTDAEAVLKPGLAGSWNGEEGDESYVIRESGSRYEIVFRNKKSDASAPFSARAFKAGGADLLDLVSSQDDPFQLPVHTIARIWLDGANLRWTFLESDWLKQQAARELAITPAEDRTLIVSPGKAVRDFLLKYGADARAFDAKRVVVLHKGT